MLGGFSDASATASDATSTWNPLAQLMPFAGSGQTGSLGDAGTALLAQFNLSTDSLAMRSGVAVAPDGTVFIADTMNGTIRRISGLNSSTPGIITSIAGKWAENQSNVTLVEPMGIALDRLGNLYIADYAAGVVDMLPRATSDTPGALLALGHVYSPIAIAVTADGRRAYATSGLSGAIAEFERPVGGFKDITVNGEAISETGMPWLDRCSPKAEQLSQGCPSGIAVDGAGNWFFAELGAGRILRVKANSTDLRGVASGLLSPGDMTFDDKGNLFVSEQGRAQILEFKGMGVPVSNLSITAPAPLPPPPSPQVCTALVNQPSAFNFCDEPIAGATPAQVFTLTNLSGSQVTGVTIAVSPAVTPSNFTILGTTCPPALNAGASCTVQLEFTPQTSGELDASLTVTDNQGDSSSSSIGGTGIDYQLALASGQGMQMNVYQGSSVSFNLQVVPDDTFADTVTFVCPPPNPGKTMVNGDMPPYTTCSFTPATAPVTPGTPVAFSVKFTTTLNFIPPPVTTPTSGMLGPFGTRPLTRSQRALLFPALAIFAMIGLVWILRRPEKRAMRTRYALAAIALAAMVCGVGAMSACHKSTPNPAIQTTPTGTTTMNVTAMSQGASRGVPITLQVIPIP
jgi:sugar lactone lactonase YvrE